MSPDARRAALALALLVPVPALGTLTGIVLAPDTTIGRAIFAACKVFVLVFPLAWHCFVERRPLSFPRPRREGLGAALLTGIAIAAVIGATAAFGGSLVDTGAFRAKLAHVGLGTPARFLAGALYWTLLNSLLEEYVWRWFVTGQFARLVSTPAAIAASAAAFTAHHVIALFAYVPPVAAALSTLGVAAGGAVWSLLYLRTRSIWPAWISHVLADAAVFAAGYALAFA